MPATWRSTDLRILVAAGVATLLLSILSFIAAPVESSPPVDGSSFAAHPQGSQAAYLALREAGYTVERSFEPLTEVRRLPANAVLILANPGSEPSQQDVRALKQFVERGGTVLATGDRGAAFLPDRPIRKDERGSNADSVAPASMVSSLARGVPEVRMTPGAPIVSVDSPYVPVYGDAARPSVIVARLGEGRAVWWSGSTPLTNSGIARNGHAELLVNVVGPASQRTVVWDEHYHGYTRSLWSYVAGTPVPFAGAQLALVFAAALLAFSRRRWPLRPQYVEPRTSPLEFVDSMGALYERAGLAAGAVETVRARVRCTLVSATGLPPASTDEDLSRGAAARTSLDATELRDLLASSAAASRDANLRPDDAWPVVAGLQELGARLQAPRATSSRRRGAPAAAEERKTE
jgi:Domain of unknown function (DUF4350)